MQATTHRATREQGPSVVSGRLIWTSATGITTADPNSYGGCTRKWWYDQVAGEKEGPTKAMEAGTVLHTEIENRLRFGTSLQTPLALSGAAFIPQPGSGLNVERAINFTTAGGIGIFGHVDLYNFRGEYIDPEGELQRDPSWSFEVKDWKTTADFQYAKTTAELGENVQLVTYAEAGFRFAPDMEHSRLTHVYFRTRGAPASKLVTIRRTREEIASRWQYSESIVRLMTDAAREPTAETVPGLRRACDAYRGCPHRTKCSVYKFDALEAIYGKIADDHVNNSSGWGVSPAQPNQENQVGLLASNPQMMNPGVTPAQPQPMNLPSQPDMRQQLADEEARQRQQLAQQQQQMPQQLNAAELQQVCIRLNGYGYGFPTLAANAAQAYAVLGGQNIAPGSVYPGVPAQAGARRSLHGIQLTEVAHIYQLEGELAKEAAANAVPVAPPPPPEPAPIPWQGAPVMKTMDAPGLSFLPPDAPQSMPQLAMQGGPRSDVMMPAATVSSELPPSAPNYAPPAEPAKAKSPGRPKKSQDAAPGPTAASAQAVPSTASPPAPASQVAPVATSAFSTGAAQLAAIEELSRNQRTSIILVNARSSRNDTKSLNEYVDYINAQLSKRYCTSSDGKPGLQDVRVAPKDSPLAFGGWKGAVREVVKADPPPEGNWHLDTFMDDLNEAVADALRVVADAKGWDYFRGMRG